MPHLLCGTSFSALSSLLWKWEPRCIRRVPLYFFATSGLHVRVRADRHAEARGGLGGPRPTPARHGRGEQPGISHLTERDRGLPLWDNGTERSHFLVWQKCCSRRRHSNTVRQDCAAIYCGSLEMFFVNVLKYFGRWHFRFT